ncbi:P-loop containing nucleoside triphosphate hydrolase protein [Obelidium mucronatum]|nr:P-loop containing nucleoside triphosphate hydrolase protein [Obelidium mucronatum]
MQVNLDLRSLSDGSPSGVILYGRAGVGKSRLLAAKKRDSPNNVMLLDCETITNDTIDELLRWTNANVPTERVLLLDNADVILSTSRSHLFFKEVILGIVDSSHSNSIFIVMATKLTPQTMDTEFTRSCRINHYISLDTKDSSDRFNILSNILADMNIPSNTFPFLQEFCDSAHGMVGADLKHVIDSLIVTKENPKEWTLSDFETERKDSTIRLKPIKPPRSFNEFYGMQETCDRVENIVFTPWRSTLSTRNNSMPSLGPRGVLIYGPSGVGKTQFGMAIAQEIGFNQVIVNGSEIRSKIVGESEANIRAIFEDVRQKSPCVLFIDQLDAVVPRRGSENTSENSGNRIVTSFLTEMDGIMASTQSESHLIIIAVTNNKDSIDPAILRPGRINEFLHIALPREKQRVEMFQGFLNGVPNNLSEADYQALGPLTENCSGADIENYCREASFVCMRLDPVNSQAFC